MPHGRYRATSACAPILSSGDRSRALDTATIKTCSSADSGFPAGLSTAKRAASPTALSRPV
jgi:hypothetical protein